jgi:hypothetical protein
MGKLGSDEIITSKHVRAFIQYSGPRPGNPVSFGGQDAQYLKIEGVGAPETGGVDPIFRHDPSRQGKYQLIGRQISPPDLASATLVMNERHNTIPKQLMYHNCEFNMYELMGSCKDLSDFLRV